MFDKLNELMANGTILSYQYMGWRWEQPGLPDGAKCMIYTADNRYESTGKSLEEAILLVIGEMMNNES